MKKTILRLTVLFLFVQIQLFAQFPTTNYKAVISDDTGATLTNQAISVRFTIFYDTAQVFQETHTTTTDENGIIVLDMGSENTADWNILDWGIGLLKLKTEFDIGSGFVDMGTKDFSIVPYASFAINSYTAEYVDNVYFNDIINTPTTLLGYGITDAFDGDYNSLTNKPTNVSDFTNDANYLTLATIPDQSADWYKIGTTNGVPDNNNDDIYHLGSINIGENVSINNTMLFIKSSSSKRNSIYTNNVSSSSGERYYGIRNHSSGSGSAGYTGTANVILENEASSTGEQTGVFNRIDNIGSGISKGVYNFIEGVGTSVKYGIYNYLNGKGQSFGVYNDFPNSNSSSQQVGIETENRNDGNGDHYGVINKLFGNGDGNQIGTSNSIDNNGTVSMGWNHIGVQNTITGSGGYKHIGVENTLAGVNNGEQIATYNNVLNTGDGAHYGSKNELSGSGSGAKIGLYSLVDETAGGQHYAIYAEATKSNSYAGFFMGETAFNGNMELSATTFGNPVSFTINNTSDDADVIINSSSSDLPTVTFKTDNAFRSSIGYSTSQNAMFIYHNGNVFVKNGNVLPEGHIIHNLGASGNAWNDVYAHNYVTQGSSAFTDRKVTDELILHPPTAKKEGDFDAKSKGGLYELAPSSLPKALVTKNGLKIDEIATYNYKANYEQQVQINELKALVLEQQKQIKELLNKIK